MTSPTKPPIFLLDAMSFIFRAYHAMQRQRPRSTRTGVPTAATFVFVNMINKLRRDFQPEYFAAVFDVSGSVFRDERARSIATVRKWNIKTQQFDELDYGGYKANRTEMPPDLAQQLPFIRRSLEAFRIPILQSEGFEADDVIGTLARQAADEGHDVVVVSNDKDMLKLVTGQIKVLNPVKDNLVLDREKVVEVLGVAPEQVIDVMALRGDSIDNIPGAPGIGDKGSVELIKRFGSVEQALDRAAEVEKKTYRESLQNNRDNILLSKTLVTIDCDVPIELNVNAMKVGEPDMEALRALFTELEFTSLLKELLPVVEVRDANYNEAKTAVDVDAVLNAIPAGGALAVAVEAESMGVEEEPEEEESESGMLPLTAEPVLVERPRDIAISPAHGVAVTIGAMAQEATSRLKSALADASLPKAIHDYK